MTNIDLSPESIEALCGSEGWTNLLKVTAAVGSVSSIGAMVPYFFQIHKFFSDEIPEDLPGIVPFGYLLGSFCSLLNNLLLSRDTYDNCSADMSNPPANVIKRILTTAQFSGQLLSCLLMSFFFVLTHLRIIGIERSFTDEVKATAKKQLMSYLPGCCNNKSDKQDAKEAQVDQSKSNVGRGLKKGKSKSNVGRRLKKGKSKTNVGIELKKEKSASNVNEMSDKEKAQKIVEDCVNSRIYLYVFIIILLIFPIGFVLLLLGVYKLDWLSPIQVDRAAFYLGIAATVIVIFVQVYQAVSLYKRKVVTGTSGEMNFQQAVGCTYLFFYMKFGANSDFLTVAPFLVSAVLQFLIAAEVQYIVEKKNRNEIKYCGLCIDGHCCRNVDLESVVFHKPNDVPLRKGEARDESKTPGDGGDPNLQEFEHAFDMYDGIEGKVRPEGEPHTNSESSDASIDSTSGSDDDGSRGEGEPEDDPSVFLRRRKDGELSAGCSPTRQNAQRRVRFQSRESFGSL